MDPVLYQEILDCNDSELDLEVLRRSIDSIDDQLLALLKQRLEIVKRVGRYKMTNPSQSQVVIRPGREAKIYQALLSTNDSGYSAQALASIWRSIIATSVNTEQKIQILAHTPKDQKDNYWLAREYFGSFTPISLQADAATVISTLEKSSNTIAVFGQIDGPFKWWRHLIPLAESRLIQIFVRIPVVAAAPSIGGPLSAPNPIGFAVAQIEPEPSHQDTSIWAIESSTPWVDLAKACSNLNIPLHLLDQDGQYFLISLPEFCVSMDASTIQALKSIPTVNRLICLGAYAAPIQPT